MLPSDQDRAFAEGDTVRLIDRVRGEFDLAWRDGVTPSLEEFLIRLPEECRASALIDLLALDVEYRSDRGLPAQQDEYARRFPQYGEAVREAFRRSGSTLTGPKTVLMGDASLRLHEPPPLRDYELLGEIARGGMGVVYRARQVSLNRVVALKRILAGQLASQDEIARFQREAEAAAHLDHPNIVPIYEVGEHEGDRFFSMKLIDGTSPSAQVSRLAEDSRAGARIVAKVARAVHHAHQRGILHRDLKPGNILIDGEGEPHVTDFGLAKRVDGNSDLTQSGAIVGTPSYMAPEQATGRKALTTAADVYSLGAILYHVLTGQKVFSADSVLQILMQVTQRDPTAPRALNPAIDRDLETICLRCLEKEPTKRYDSAAALADDLDRWLRGEPIAARPVGNVERAWRWSRRNPLIASLAAAVAALLVLAATGATVGYYREAALRRTAVRERDVARDMRNKEAEARRDADEQRKAALVAQAEEAALRKTAQRSLVENHFERGRTLCQKGEVAQGLLWMSRALETLPAHAADLEPTIRRNLAAWEPQLFAHRLVIRHGEKVWNAAFSSDGMKIATGSEDGTARLWDASTGAPIGAPMAHGAKVRRVAFNSDGSLLLTGSEDHTARLWNARTGMPVGDPLPHPREVGGAAFSPDDTLIATGDWAGNLRLWDAATREPIGEPMRFGAGISSVAFSPDGRRIAAGSTDNTARIWDVATRTPVGQPLRHDNWIADVDFSPDGATLVTACKDGTCRLWNVSTGEPAGRPLDLPGWVRRAEFNSAGTLLASGSDEGTARLWETTTGKRFGPELRHPGSVTVITFSPDGKLLLMGGGDGVVRLLRVGIQEPERRTLPHPHRVYSVAFSPDGKTLFTTCEDGAARLWDVRTERPIGEPLRHAGPVFYLAISRDGRRLVTGSADRTARLWDVDTGRLLCPPLQHPEKVLGVAFSGDEKIVLTGCSDTLVRFWDVGSGELDEPALKHDHPVSSVAVSSDGSLILTATMAGSLQLWNASTRRPVGRTILLQGTVLGATFSPDGTLILAGGADKTVRIWSVSSREPQGKPLVHSAAVVGSAFNSYSRLILTGGAASAGHLWDAATQEPIGPPLPHALTVNGVGISPDGNTLATASDDRTVRLWKTPVAVSDDPQHIALWIQVLTCMELQPDGAILELDCEAWQERRRRLTEREAFRSHGVAPQAGQQPAPIP